MNRPIEPLIVQCWDHLIRALHDKKHPYRLAVVSGLDASGRPRGRTVVLRQADRGSATLSLYTDARTTKIAGLEHNNWLCWTFWHPRQNLQTIASGPSEILAVTDSRPYFDQLAEYNWKDYASPITPGRALVDSAPTAVDPAIIEARARHNFRIIRTQLQEMDILRLDRVGHERMIAKRVGSAWETQTVQS